MYSVDPSRYVPAEGYIVKTNANGTWAVLADVDGAEEMVYHQASGLFYNGNDAGWKGVYYVMNASDLKKAAAYFAGQSHSNEGNGITIELMSDIDLAGSTWEPWNVMWLTLNGNGHTISNITCAEGWRSGFFAYIGASKVNDLTLKNVVSAGAQAGLFAGSIEGVTVNGLKIAGQNFVSYVENPSETYGGIGAVTGILVDAAVNGEIVQGATVSVDYNDIVTLAERQSALTGYLQANKGVFSLKGNLQSGAAVYQFSDNGTKVSLKPAEDNATTMRSIVEYSNVESAVVEEGIQVLGNRTFRACPKLVSVELPSTLTTIEEGAFQKSGITSIEIPENVTYIGTTALGACSALETVIIKAKDITIANYCARGCANLRSVYIYSDNVVFEQDGRASMHFTNQESNNASSITYYVKNQNVADALNASVPTTHAKGMKIASIDGATIYYTR